ncbi:MAG: amidohydrolase family protein, partial [Thermoanaerobaculia bacterium]
MTRPLPALLLLLTFSVATTAGAELLAFTGATLHPVSSPPVEGGVMLVEDGKITAVAGNLEIPADARRIELDGKHLYPSFIHPFSALGLVEIRSVRGTVDTTEVGDVNSNVRAEVAFHADSQLLPVTVSGGVLVAHVTPRGGLFNGTSALMRLAGWNWQDMTLAAPLAMHLDFPDLRPPVGRFRRLSQEEVDKEKKRALEVLDRTLADARAYDTARRAEEAGEGPAVPHDPRLEALRPVLSGDLPLFIEATEKTQIEAALDWAAEQELTNLVLVTGADAQYLTARLVADEVPVVLNGVLRQPARDWEPYDAAYIVAARLHEAGIAFCIGDGGSSFGAANARNLPFHAAMAAAFGLPRDAALRSVTLSVAELLGVADRLGSLEPGKDATFIVTDGDPLEILTRIEAAWLEGVELDPSRDRQRLLYQRYDN